MFPAIPSLVLALAISPTEWLEKDTLDWFGRQGTNWSIVWMDTWKATTNSEGQWWFFPDTNIAWGDYAAGWMEITNPATSEYAIGRRVVTLPIPSPGYYVAKTGSDTNPGTFSQPFLTVQKGLNSAQPGDSIRIGEGTYAENVTTPRSGTNGAPIALDGQGVATLHSISISAQYISVINLRLAGKTNAWTGLISIRRGGHHCVVSNNILDREWTANTYAMVWDSPSTKPFGADAASDCLIVSNTILHGWAYPMVSMMGDRNEFQGNRLIDSANVDWIRIWGRSNHIVANTFSNNMDFNLSGNHPDFVQSFGSSGIGSSGHIIENNIIVKCDGDTQFGMLEQDGIPECENWEFRNNLIIGVALKMSAGFPRMRFYNNLFLNCTTNPLGAGHVLLFGNTTNRTDGTGGQVFNNIFASCGNPSNDTTGWYSFPLPLTNIAADYNYVGKVDYKPVHVDPQHRPIGSSNGWYFQYWWEDHGINGGNPLFVDEANGDFRLATNSPLAGRGTNLSALFNTDFTGIPRPQRWSIGPFEPVEVAPPVYTLTAPSNLVVLN